MGAEAHMSCLCGKQGWHEAGETCPLDERNEPTADATLEGRRFHRHARNCPWCLGVLEAEQGSEASNPGKLCEDGRVLLAKAIQAHQEGAPA